MELIGLVVFVVVVAWGVFLSVNVTSAARAATRAAASNEAIATNIALLVRAVAPDVEPVESGQFVFAVREVLDNGKANWLRPRFKNKEDAQTYASQQRAMPGVTYRVEAYATTR